MLRNGLYLNHSAEGHMLVIICENDGQTLWIRNFVTLDSALDVLQDDVLAGHERGELVQILAGKKGYFDPHVEEPIDGYTAAGLARYTRS